MAPKSNKPTTLEILSGIIIANPAIIKSARRLYSHFLLVESNNTYPQG